MQRLSYFTCNCLLENLECQDQSSICLHILYLEKEFGSRKAITAKPMIMKDIQNVGVVGFFDGATKNGLCATGSFND